MAKDYQKTLKQIKAAKADVSDALKNLVKAELKVKKAKQLEKKLSEKAQQPTF